MATKYNFFAFYICFRYKNVTFLMFYFQQWINPLAKTPSAISMRRYKWRKEKIENKKPKTHSWYVFNVRTANHFTYFPLRLRYNLSLCIFFGVGDHKFHCKLRQLKRKQNIKWMERIRRDRAITHTEKRNSRDDLNWKSVNGLQSVSGDEDFCFRFFLLFVCLFLLHYRFHFTVISLCLALYFFSYNFNFCIWSHFVSF